MDFRDKVAHVVVIVGGALFAICGTIGLVSGTVRAKGYAADASEGWPLAALWIAGGLVMAIGGIVSWRRGG